MTAKSNKGLDEKNKTINWKNEILKDNTGNLVSENRV